jgi:mRNA interferase HigB
VKLIKPTTIQAWATQHPTAGPSLREWLSKIKAAECKDWVGLKKIFASADQVKVKSGRSVVIFNISGNNYRLIAAIHLNRQKAYALAFLTHAEYSKDRWKNTL